MGGASSTRAVVKDGVGSPRTPLADLEGLAGGVTRKQYNGPVGNGRAERVGFEPTVRVTPDNALAGRPIRPLWHLSSDSGIVHGREKVPQVQGETRSVNSPWASSR